MGSNTMWEFTENRKKDLKEAKNVWESPFYVGIS